jgi:hypothetical protein
VASLVLKEATLLHCVEGCHAAPWFWRMPRCSMLLMDATLPHCPRSSVATFNTTKQRGILQHHGAAWHPSSRSSMASSNTTEKRCILQHGGAVRVLPFLYSFSPRGNSRCIQKGPRVYTVVYNHNE